jgi:hypothetical protein
VYSVIAPDGQRRGRMILPGDAAEWLVLPGISK